MRVVVQQLETGLFLDEAGAWTAEAGVARDFVHTAEAIVYCVMRGLQDVRIGMIFGHPELDLYFYPFQNELREQARELRERNATLKARQRDLVEEVRAAVADIAEKGKRLPLRRKKKREKPPEE